MKHLIWQLKKHLIKYNVKSKIRKIKCKRNTEFEDKCIDYHTKLGVPSGCKKYYSIYSELSGNKDVKYTPEILYYTFIEPKLNKKFLNVAYTDKGNYECFIDKSILVDNLVVYSNGSYKLSISNEIMEEIVVNKGVVFKPSIESGGGAGIRFVDKFEEYVKIKNYFEEKYDDFVVQEVIEQHPFFSKFNRSSLNTIRCLVYKSPIHKQAFVINSVLRVGAKDSKVDNQASGGRAIGITDGLLGKFSINKYGNKSDYANNINLKENQFLIPNWERFIEAALCSSKNLNHAMIIGVDLCLLNSGEVKVIEVNCFNNEINFFQMTNGPLFGDFTEEIYTLAKSKKIHYYFRGIYDK